MKTFDFGKGILNESKVINNKVNEERVDEMFGAILVCSVLGGLIAKNSIKWWKEFKKDRREMYEDKLRTQELKQKYKENKEKEKAAKKAAKEAAAMEKYLMAQEKTLAKMPDGPEKDKLLDGLRAAKAIRNGNPTPDQITTVQTASEEPLSPEVEKLSERMHKAVDKYSNDPEFQKRYQAFMEKYEKGRAAFEAADTEEQKKQLQAAGIDPDKKPEEKESKTDDELKQELKDKCKDLDGKAIPEQVRDDDGKFSEEKLNALSGDDLKKTANAAGIKTTKDAPKPEEKKDSEGETKPEEKKDSEGEEDNPQDGDERTDNDDDLEDEKWGQNKEGKLTIDDKNKDPRKIYKQRTYKRGNKTFKTKSYYSKKGVAITKDEFRERLQAYEKKNAKKNESFEGFIFTHIGDATKKHVPVTEAKSTTDRVDIIKERLIYIKYVMDTTSNSVEKVQMERMYNALYNLTFNSDGTPRSLKDLYTYLNQVMVENKGKIEGLPTESQIENIDEKVQAFKELHEDKYKAYLTRLDKELLDKAGNKGNDAAADLLHPAGDESDSEIINKIREMSSIYGFTNIIGLEPERKPNPEDDKKKNEIELQQKAKTTGIDTDDNKDVKADDVSDEQIDKIIGTKK